MKTFLDENPDAIKDLENFGFDIQKRFQKGKPNIIQPKAKPGQDFKQTKENIQQQKKRPIQEGIEKVNTFEDIMKNRAKYLEDKKPIDAVILQTSKTQTKIDPTAPGRGKLDLLFGTQP